MENKILVIGGTGNIGRTLTQSLKSKKAEFTLLVRDPQKMKDLEEMGVHSILGDYTDQTLISQALKSVDTLFLLTTPHPDMAEHEINIIMKAKAAGVNHIINISALGADQDNETLLGKNHAKTEQFLQRSDVNYTILRPHSFMQNTLMNAATIIKQGAFYGTMKNAKVPLVDARDIGEAAANICVNPQKHKNKIYPITGPEAITQDEMAQIISKTIDKEVQYKSVPDEAAKSAMMNIGIPEWLVDDLLALNRRWEGGEDNKVHKDLENLLGRNSKDYKTFVKDHAFVFEE